MEYLKRKEEFIMELTQVIAECDKLKTRCLEGLNDIQKISNWEESKWFDDKYNGFDYDLKTIQIIFSC